MHMYTGLDMYTHTPNWVVHNSIAHRTMHTCHDWISMWLRLLTTTGWLRQARPGCLLIAGARGKVYPTLILGINHILQGHYPVVITGYPEWDHTPEDPKRCDLRHKVCECFVNVVTEGPWTPLRQGEIFKFLYKYLNTCKLLTRI